MKLLLKLLKPDVVPSPRRKSIPFRTRVQLLLYGLCIKILRKWYSKYAFSDSIMLVGKQSIKLTHEYRDYSFEGELKRLHYQIPDTLKAVTGITSSLPKKQKIYLFRNYFSFEDRFLLEIDGQKISIEHNRGCSFNSSFKGQLKESDSNSLISRYVFSGSLKLSGMGLSGERKHGKPNTAKVPFESEILPEANVQPTTVVPSSRSRDGLFSDDPLFRKGGVPDERTNIIPSSIKEVEGVTIDESF